MGGNAGGQRKTGRPLRDQAEPELPHVAVEAHLQDTRVAFLMGAPQGLAGKELSSGGRGFWETLSRLLPSSWPLSLLLLGNPPRLV